jgi:phenylacetic acid degradation operon negative regulatory protein
VAFDDAAEWLAIGLGEAGFGCAATECVLAAVPHPAASAASNAIPAADRMLVSDMTYPSYVIVGDRRPPGLHTSHGCEPPAVRCGVQRPAAGRGYVACVTTFTGPPGGGEAWSAQPRALIVTIYGLYARETGGWLSVASLIRLMAELGSDEPAVRSSISRLKHRGVLESRREGGAAGYALSDRGHAILAEGDQRIFDRPRARVSDGWLLAVFSVPERERSRRHALRSRLAWLGFGTVSAGVWIAPGHLAGETAGVLERHHLAGYVDLFRAEYLAFGDVAEQVARWWDLDRLQGLYQAFLDDAGPVLARWDHASPDETGGGAFADYVRALTAWRRLPFLDPGLPAEVLPGGWNGRDAAAAFAALRQRLARPARAHARAVIGGTGQEMTA